MEQEKYQAALVQFKKVLKSFPNNSNALWNAGTAAFFIRDYKLAANYFERNLKQEPQNGFLVAKLVQTYQALGDIPRRDARRNQVFAMHRSGKDSSGYTKKDSYCRDQFTVNGDRVIALETFELRPSSTQNGEYSFGVRYEFYVTASKQENPKMSLEVGWNALEPDGKGGYRPLPWPATFYFDAYYAQGEYSRKTFGLFQKELPYEAVKKRLIDILNGKVAMSSGRRRDAKGPGT